MAKGDRHAVGRLAYAVKVDTGITDKELSQLEVTFKPLVTSKGCDRRRRAGEGKGVLVKPKPDRHDLSQRHRGR